LISGCGASLAGRSAEEAISTSIVGHGTFKLSPRTVKVNEPSIVTFIEVPVKAAIKSIILGEASIDTSTTRELVE
jgi:hypothetical protein